MSIERVAFVSEGETVVGHLHLPEGGGPFPAAVLLGPLTSVKEQVTDRYGDALARRGWAALSFDPRHFGESEGRPRQYESPRDKIDDVRSAVSFLSAHDRVHADRIVGVGICAGAGYMAGAVAIEPRLRAFGAVAGFYHDAAKQREWSGAGYDAALARATVEREAWERTGIAAMIPAVGKQGEVAMPLDEAFEYYGTARGGSLGGYVNAFALMSRAETLPYDAQHAAPRIGVPTILVHGENALAPALARAFYAALVVETKAIHWVASKGQIDFYDDPACIEPAADRLDDALRSAVR